MPESKWRGANIAPYPIPGDVTYLYAANGNIGRYNIAFIGSDGGENNCEQWKAFIRSHLDFIDKYVFDAMPDEGKLGIDIHHAPGGYGTDGHALMFSTRPWGLECLTTMWEEIALRYKDNPKVFWYGILNEPAGPPAKVWKLQQEIITRVRAIDHSTKISVSVPFALPKNFDGAKPYIGKNLWYEVHCYNPMQITHQGLFGNPAPRPYPGQNWNKNRLMAALNYVRKFQKEYDVKIFVGEFSISTYAPIQSRLNYLSDCISIFEEYNWNWSYHAWNTMPVGPWDCVNTPQVLDLLKEAWEKNEG